MKASTILAITGLSLASGLAFAQQAPSVTQPPKVLQIIREYLKPGKAGVPHQKTEAAFVKAMADNKWATHYFAMDSLTGPSRSLFFVAYPSFEAWGKDVEATNANGTLSAAMDEATQADGELLSKYESSVFLFHPEMSLHAAVDIPHMRYFEITQFVIKTGHTRDFENLAKMYIQGYDKVPSAHWATFESVYGENNGGVYIILNPMRTLTEVDQGMADAKQFEASLGESGMKNAADLAAACIQSVQTNVFIINPKMSYPMDDWAKADPDFWGQH